MSKLIKIKRARFHESIQVGGESITFFPLPKYTNRFRVFLDPELFTLRIYWFDKELERFVEIPLTNAVYYEREEADKPKITRRKTKPKVVQN